MNVAFSCFHSASENTENHDLALTDVLRHYVEAINQNEGQTEKQKPTR